ncbi:MAG: hypothetical protein SV186_06755 [Candidatus Nanohaloarchaea archaeon]|nr:hypothetical protein [Candidatus Nanohaloarchaea archaeon]
MRFGKTLLIITVVAASISLGAAAPVDQVSCNSYTLHDIDASSITYSDDPNNNKNLERYMSPREEVSLEFEYNLPACDNSADHSRHVVRFYDGQGRYLGKKVDLQMKQGNWDSYTTYNVPITIPEFNTSTVRVVVDIYSNSVHGSDVWHEQNIERAYDKVITDTVPEAGDRLNLDKLPVGQDNIQMLKDAQTTSNFWGDCANIARSINNNSYVTNPGMPGLHISRDNWYMDSGGGHPCYIFSAYEQARAMYNWFKVIDYNSQNDNKIGKAGACGPNPNRQHNGAGYSTGHSRTFKRACPDYNGEWVASGDNVACDDGSRMQASNHDGEIITIDRNGKTTHYVSDGSNWIPETASDSSQNACQAFIDAQGKGNWADSGEIVAEASGVAGARCNLELTQDKFIVGKTLYRSGEKVDCTSPTGVQESVTIKGTTYYCKGIS